MPTMEDSSIREPLLSSPKGGLRTLPFIIANEAFEKAANLGLLPNMILYLTGGYGFELAAGLNIIYFWSAATNLTPVIGAFLGDFYGGRFTMISFGCFISLLGMILLWLTSIIPGARPCDDSGSHCTSRNAYQLILLVSSFVLTAVGAGGIRSSSLVFGADQLVKGTDVLGDAAIIERFFNWYYAASAASSLLALTLLVYIQELFGWQVGYGVPVILMLLSTLSFFVASPLYVKVKASRGSPNTFAQVLVASWRKRHLSSKTPNQVYLHRRGSRLATPSEKLRFLNKACIVINAKEELSPDGAPLDQWNVCTVDQVEECKVLLKAIPMWSTGIMVCVAVNQSGLPTIQAESMDRHVTSNFEIPAGSISAFVIVAAVLWIALYDSVILPLATRIMRKPVRLSARTRMGIGLLISFVSMVLAALVEAVRRKAAVEAGLSDDPNAVVKMSAFWLLPYICFCGVATAMFMVGQNEFFYSEFPKSMLSVATNLSTLGLAIGSLVASLITSIVDSLTSKGGSESWVSSNINKGHIDYFFWLLAGLSLLNCLYYLVCSKAYGPSKDQAVQAVQGDEQEVVDE